MRATSVPQHLPDGVELPELRELVVCSLEAWDDVWRRNQFFTDALLCRSPSLRILFIEPAADVLFELTQLRWPQPPRLRAVGNERRLQAFRPFKPLPRRLGSFSDRWLCRRVIEAARRLGFTRPTLWLNDVTYAPLTSSMGWPTLYDVTDDWLLAPFPTRELDRLRRLEDVALSQAEEVVVCSPALAASRGSRRAVTVVSNGVDIEHFRQLRPRPDDLPPAPTAVYVGTLHESRLDIDLLTELADADGQLSVVLVGPDSLAAAPRHRLSAAPNIHMLGARPYADVPGYLQHADVIIVPHLITPFTESLDPIKAYECAVVETPVVATPVAGFRELSSELTIAPAEEFVAGVMAALSAPPRRAASVVPPSWTERAETFEFVLRRAGAAAAPSRPA